MLAESESLMSALWGQELQHAVFLVAWTDHWILMRDSLLSPARSASCCCLSVQVYQSVHMIGFLGYILFALIHYPGMWVSVVPGDF